MGCLPWGIQWEVARYTALGLSYGDIDFDRLKGSTNKQASEELKDIVKSCRGNLQTSQTVDEGFAAAFKDETAAKVRFNSTCCVVGLRIVYSFDLLVPVAVGRP